MAGAMAVADGMVGKMEVTWERDEKGVILYGEGESRDPFFGSVIFSKQFLDRFKEQLGAEIYVVLPEQGRIFLFPKFGGKLEGFAGALTDIYQGSALRVSLEVFLVSEAGCRAVGTLGADPQK